MQNVKNLDHLNMTVANLKESIGWYQAVFGFCEVESGTTDSGPWAIIRSGEAMLCLYQHPEHRPPQDRRQENIHGVNHFALRIADPERFSQILAKLKIPVAYGGAFDWPHSTSWYIKDPDGYSLEVVRWQDDQINF